MVGGRSTRILGMTLVLALAACGGAAPVLAPQTTTPKDTANGAIPSDVTLATVDAGTLPFDPNVPLLIVREGHVWMDGRDLADAREITREKRIARIDPLWQALKSRREAWKAAHGAASFDGKLQIAFDQHDGMKVVKSIFQTAAFSGYPNQSFVVRRGDGAVATLQVSAYVPGPPVEGKQPDSEFLVAEVGNGSTVAFWQKRDTPAGASLGGSRMLAPAAKTEWSTHGLHRTPNDPLLDRAFLLVADDQTFGVVAASTAALLSVTRDRQIAGKTQTVSALDVMFTISGHADHPEDLGSRPTVRLPPAEIQKVVRAGFGPLRTCYEAGLTRDAKLAGKVEVRFTIDREGKVSGVQPTENTDLGDPAVVSCVVSEYGKLAFPKPEGGIVTVVYPIIFNPSP